MGAKSFPTKNGAAIKAIADTTMIKMEKNEKTVSVKRFSFSAFPFLPQ